MTAANARILMRGIGALEGEPCRFELIATEQPQAVGERRVVDPVGAD